MPSKTRILHLEDIPTDAELIKDKLEQEHFDCVIVSVDNKKDFIKELSGFNPDLVLSDNKLPDINAQIALETVQKEKPDVPVIIVTGTMDEETAVELMKAGASDYVLKENLSRLAPALKNALEKKRIQEEKDEAEKQMHMAKERMQYLLFSTSAIIYSAKVDSLYSFTFLSENVAKMTHFSATEIMEKSAFWMNHIHRGDQERIKEESLILFEQEKVTHEYRFKRKDGSYIWLRDEKKLVCNKENSPLEIVGHIINITERKKVEGDLRESENSYRSVVSVMAEGILVQVRDGSIKMWNKRAEQLLGLTKEKIQHNPGRVANLQAIHLDGTVFPAETQPSWVTFKTGKPCSDVIMGLPGTAGNPIWLSVNSQPIFQKDELKPSMVVTSFSDITDRLLAENAQKLSEQRFSTVFNEAAIGMAILDFDDTPVRVNPAFEKMFGYSADELGDMIFTDITYKEDVDKLRDLFQELIGGKRDQYFTEKRYVKKNGDIIWGSLGVSMVKNALKEPLYAVAMVEDITERKNTEVALKKSEERYRQFFENDISGVCASTVDGTPIDCNPAFLRIFGFDSIEGLKNVNMRTLCAKPEERDKIIRHTKKRGQVLNHEIEMRNKKGEPIHCIQNVYGVFDDHGRLTQLMEYFFNITDRKKLEQQLLQSQKLEAIGLLAGGIAHDFNNLLTIINGYSEILLKDPKDKNKFRKGIEEINAAGKRAAILTSQLLSFSRRQIVRPKFINPNHAILNIKNMLGRLINENIQIKTVLDNQIANIKIDDGQFDQLIINLIVNARDAMPDGGTITIETQLKQIDEEYTKLHMSETPGKYVQLSVSDTGHGMDENIRSQIFEPFFTTKKQGKGTGLGLATVYGIIKQAGGDIWVYSEVGRGTTFKIYFPNVKAKPALSEKKKDPKNNLRGSETVLLVEDEPALRSLTGEFLTGYGYKVIEVSNVNQAASLMQKSGGKVNLLITDVVMLGINGPELAAKLSSLYPGLKVLYITGYTESTVLHSIIAEDHSILTKPFSSKELAAKVRETLDSQ